MNTYDKAFENARDILIQTRSNKGGVLGKLRNQFLHYPRYFK